MFLTKPNILKKTNSGLGIYAFVLKQYFPDHLLKISGYDCQVTKNPFNGGKLSLLIRVSEGMARHTDLEEPQFQGDVFDFANRYFKAATEEELCFLINQNLHLGLQVAAEDNLAWLDEWDDCWRPSFSYFKPPIRNVLPSREVDLPKIFKLITGERLKPITEQLRALVDARERREFKAGNFPYVTFAGVFTKRRNECLLRPSGLMVLDFDDLNRPEEVRATLLQDRFFDTELLFLSPSGNGLKWIIRFNEGPERYTRYFQAVCGYLKKTYGLEADASGKDISRACFLCHDPGAVMHVRYGGNQWFEGSMIQ